MDTATAPQLLMLNQRFYDICAAAYAQTRGPMQQGLQRILPYLPPEPAVLDLGCGNGRLAYFLANHRARVIYMGVDGSAPLLLTARQTVSGLPAVTSTFVQAQLTQPDWAGRLPAVHFDAVCALAVVHHLPGFEQRVHFLREARRCLPAAGVLVVSYWQFLDDPIQRAKVVPWESAGIHPGQVDAGDALLRWARGAAGLRYCHHVDAAEAAALAEAAGLRVLETYWADGRSRRANLFQICQAN